MSLPDPLSCPISRTKKSPSWERCDCLTQFDNRASYVSAAYVVCACAVNVTALFTHIRSCRKVTMLHLMQGNGWNRFASISITTPIHTWPLCHSITWTPCFSVLQHCVCARARVRISVCVSASFNKSSLQQLLFNRQTHTHYQFHSSKCSSNWEHHFHSLHVSGSFWLTPSASCVLTLRVGFRSMASNAPVNYVTSRWKWRCISNKQPVDSCLFLIGAAWFSELWRKRASTIRDRWFLLQRCDWIWVNLRADLQSVFWENDCIGSSYVVGLF